MRILHVVGARPNFMKVAPIMRAFSRYEDVEQSLVHTGQHYDESLSDHFFSDLEIPTPDLNLGVGSGSHAVQTARIMIALEPVLERQQPDWVFVVGDVNSTLAAALVSAKAGIPVAHVEAGLRSGDWSMPEELNRVLTDAIASALFTTEPSATDNLLAEGVAAERIHHVGNVMIDTLDRYRPRAAKLAAHEALNVPSGGYALVTLHKPSNVDDPVRLAALLQALAEVRFEFDVPVVFPLHPRTARNIRRYGLDDFLSPLLALAPLRYLEFLCLMDHAGLVLTDSGGVQEETTVLGVPCITLHHVTDRPITVIEGTNRVFDGDPEDLVEAAGEALASERRPSRPALWDGKTGPRIAAVTMEHLAHLDRADHSGARVAALP